VLRPDQARPISDRSAARVVKILLESPELDVTWSHFGPHEAGADLHVHHEHDDGFYVLEGELTFSVGVDGFRLTCGPGTLVVVPVGVVHGFDNASDADAVWLNFHAPSTGFAAYLRGERETFDSHQPPADGGLPESLVVVRKGDVRVETERLSVRVQGKPDEQSFALGDGRFVNVRAR